MTDGTRGSCLFGGTRHVQGKESRQPKVAASGCPQSHKGRKASKGRDISRRILKPENDCNMARPFVCVCERERERERESHSIARAAAAKGG